MAPVGIRRQGHGDFLRADRQDREQGVAEAVRRLAAALQIQAGGAAGADECGVPAGRLGAGRLADLLVVDGDVAADITALSRPAAAWVGGARVQP